ncbi:MAG: hypothetical protein ACI97A_003907, partial [Planctomycetota bacterium]
VGSPIGFDGSIGSSGVPDFHVAFGFLLWTTNMSQAPSLVLTLRGWIRTWERWRPAGILLGARKSMGAWRLVRCQAHVGSPIGFDGSIGSSGVPDFHVAFGFLLWTTNMSQAPSLVLTLCGWISNRERRRPAVILCS